MSYRPQVKQPNGQMVDIPLDAETVKGKNVSAEINNIISGAQVVGNATNDAQGNNIAATYATKSELAAAGQFDPNGTYPNLTAGNATNATNAANATNATNDGQGRNIANTYALKGEGGKLYKHTITFTNARYTGTNEYVTLVGVLFLPKADAFTSDNYDEVAELLKYTAFSGNTVWQEINCFSGTFYSFTKDGDQYKINTLCPGIDKADYVSFIQYQKTITDVVTEA